MDEALRALKSWVIFAGFVLVVAGLYVAQASRRDSLNTQFVAPIYLDAGGVISAHR